MERRGAGNVATAFQMMLEELDREIDEVKAASKLAVDRSDYDAANETLEFARAIEQLRRKVVALRDEWERPAAGARRPGERQGKYGGERTRTRRGEATPQEQYCRPVLTALVELGGSARADDVLRRVEREMRAALRPRDYEPMESDPNLPRWRSNAMWARNTMREDGRIKEVARRGIWEISDAGRAWLESEAGG